MFITFEGIDGSGKTTQIQLLQRALQSQEKTVCVTREPGGAPLAEAIREMVLSTRQKETVIAPRAELLLFMAARAQNVEETIRPALARGEIVLCDRFTDSSEAYQGALGLEREHIAWLNRFATHRLFPDLTFWLDVDEHESLRRRAAARGESADRIEERGLVFQQKVRAAFAQIAAREPQRFLRLDAAKSAEEVHQKIVQLLETRF